MATWRMIPPGLGNNPAVVIQNRSYSVALGSFVDVPDFDGQVLRANNWVCLGQVGTTAQRTSIAIGLNGINSYVDTTLGYAVFWDGALWRDTSGVAR